MSEEKKKKNKIIGISIGIVVVLLVVISSTYAYWQITISQNDPNSVISQCLSLEMINQTGTFGLEDAYPIEDNEGLLKEGFTFDVINNCDRDIAYVVGIDSLEVDSTQILDGYMKDTTIKVSIDGTTPKIYGNLETIDHIAEDNNYTIRNSKEINTAIVKANSKNTHNIKAWIDYDAPVSENNKVFSGRVFITGGQFIENDNPIIGATAEECFTMNGGEIIKYDDSCGPEVVIPATVNGVAVTTIDTHAFKKYKTINYNVTFSDVTEIESFDYEGANIVFVLDGYTKGQTIDFSKLVEAKYVIALTDDPEFIALGQQFGLNVYTEENVPEKVAGEFYLYLKMSNVGEVQQIYGGKFVDYAESLAIESLDLSIASNLNLIEIAAFSDVSLIEDKDVFDGCVESFANPTLETKGLKKLVFGTQKELKVGDGAFSGLNTDKLDVYTNLKGINANCNSENYGVISIMFSGANIQELNVYPVGSNGNFDTLNTVYGPFSASNITKINIKSGIKSLGRASFFAATTQEINLPAGLTTIGMNAFGGVKVSNVVIPKSVTYVGDYAFSSMDDTSSITVKNPSSISTNWGKAWSGEATVNYDTI